LLQISSAIAWLTVLSLLLCFRAGSIRVSQGHMTGGDVLNVMFAALLGSFSLGMVSR
jgi:hypothetical protein